MDEGLHWDRVYGTRSAEELSWFQPHAARSLAIIRRIARDKACRVVDVGGGA